MAPSRKKSKAAAAAAARRQWKIGDLVLAKVKGFPAWPATVSEPEKWGYSTDWKKVLVYFFGTKQIAFCNPADVEEFTEEKKHLLLGKRQGRGADFVRAVQEIAACFDKLKENKGIDERSAGGAPVENAVNGDPTASNDSVPDATLNSTVKSSNSSRLEDEPGTTLEDVGAVTEVEALKQRGPSEEQENNAVGCTLSLPNTYTLRKKSRSSQPQRPASKKKVSAQRSRSSLHFNPHGLHNGKLKCSDNENSDDVGVNGFSDDSLRKAKKCKQSPELTVPGIGNSPTCNSNGIIEDNGSEIALADSENLSNIEGSVIESGHKRERFDILGGSCDGGLELCRRFDFQATTTVVRKKRNPGRKRAQNDGLESISRSDLEVRNETQALRDTLVLQASCQSFVDTHPKSEGDEHLPLVKRARVRMGKLLAEDNQQLDHAVQTEGKCLESISTNACRLPRTSLICDDKCSSKNVLAVSELMSSPVDTYNQLADRLQSPKTDICVVNESVLCSPVDNSVQIAGDQPQTWKTKSNQFTFGCVFDGEAALPPSKRLHRALEAMSANAAEENHTLVEISSSTKEGAEETDILSTKSKSDMIVDHEDDNTTDLQKYKNGSTDDYSGRSNLSKPSCYEMITKSFQEVSMSDSPGKILKGEKAYSEEDRAICTENKDLSVSENVREPDNVLPDQASKALTSGNDSGILLDSVLTEPSLEILTKFEEDEVMLESGTGCKNSEDEVHSGGDKNSSVEEEKVIVGCSVGISADLRSEEDRTTVVNGILKASLDKEADGISNAVDEINNTETEERMNVASLAPLNALTQQTSHHASDSGDLAKDSSDTTNITTLDVNRVKQMHASLPNSLLPASDNLYHSPHKGNGPMDAKTPHVKHSEDAAESGLDISMGQQGKPGERTNLAEVKAALASLELTLGSLTRTKESIGRATRIAVDCVKFGSAAEVVDLLALYLEKESSLYRRVDLFFLVDSIAQCSRGLKGEVGAAYISAVKETLARMLSAAAPPGQAARENRRQCLKVLRLWLERRIFPESIICQHIRELDSLNCSSSTGGYSRRMSRTERSFDDPLRDMEGMMVDEYGSNSSFQLPGFCMPRMLKEDDGSDSDDGSFEAVTPEHDPKYTEPLEANAVVATEKHRHILEDVDGELEMEDVAPSSEIELDRSTTTGGATASDAHSCKEQFASFVPPLPHDVPPRAPPLPTSPPPLPPLPPPPPPPPPPLAPHVSTMPHLGVDSQLHGGRNSMQEAIPPRPPASGIHHPMQMPPSTSCSYNSYPAMHNPVAPGNNIQPMDGNLYGKAYNLRPPYPSSSNQFSYLPPDQQGRSQREVPPPPYYDRSRFAQGAEGGHVYGDHDNIRPPRHEMTDGWGYSRPSFPSHCEPRPQHHGWAYPPHPVHHQNHFPTRPPCDGGVPVAARAPGYWHPR